MSSCSTAFFGGIYRKMKKDAEIMMHSPYIKTGFISIQCASTTQATKLKNYYNLMLGWDTGNLLYERTMKYCSTNDGWRLNKDAAELYGILK